MKKNNIFLALLLMMLPFVAGAQALKGSYFLENSINAHKMNPAFAPRANYFQLVAIGNTGLGVNSNLNLSTLLYPMDGKLATFLHPDVSVEQFAKDLPDHLSLDADVSTTVLSFGWFNKKKAFWNFTLDVHAMADVDLPSDLFMFLKKGPGAENSRYNVGNINAYAMGNVRASLGWSRELAKGFRAGLKVRAVLPVAYAGLNLEDVSLTASSEKWRISTEGYLHTAMQGLTISQQEKLGVDVGFDMDKFLSNRALAGMGYSVDLGLQYTLEAGTIFDGLNISAAVTDLGQIYYKSNCMSAFTSSGSYEWTGKNDLVITEEIDFDGIVEEVKEGLMGLVNLSEKDVDGRYVKSTMPRVYAGIEVPFLWRRMSVGLLYSSRFSHSYARQELTASYNLTPCKWFALGVNYSFRNTRDSVGAIFEFTPKAGPTLYLGCDYFPAVYVDAPILEDVLGEAPSFIKPVTDYLGVDTWPMITNVNFNFNFGIAFNMGSKHVNPKKDKK